MNQSNALNKAFNCVKNRLKRLLSIVAVLCLVAISSQVKTYPHIIPLKGLFTVLKVDDIGFAHALLHSKWIENMYQYGAGKPHRKVPIKKGRDTSWRAEYESDAVANLIRKFWFRKSENHQLLPTKFGFIANIPNDQLGTFFGKLINYVYFLTRHWVQERPSSSLCQGVGRGQEAKLIDELVKYAPDYKQFRQELTALTVDAINEEYKLQDVRFSGLQEAHQKFRQILKGLQQEFAITEFSQELKQAKKKYKKKKNAFQKEERRLQEKFKKSDFDRVVQEAEKEVFVHVSQEVLNLREEYKEIARAVQDLKNKINGKLKQKSKIVKKALFDPICKALQLCKTGEVYMPRTTEGILWALFFHKLNDLISLEEKVVAINDCIRCIDTTFKREAFCENGVLKEFYSKKAFDAFEEEMKKLSLYRRFGFYRTLEKRDENDVAHKQFNAIFVDYGLGLHYFIRCLVGGDFPPEIAQGSYGYEYEPGKISHTRPDCHETATLDLLSILWYNRTTKVFDDSLFSDDVIKNALRYPSSSSGQAKAKAPTSLEARDRQDGLSVEALAKTDRGNINEETLKTEGEKEEEKTGFQRLREALKYFYLADAKGIKAQEYTCEYKNKKFTSLAKLKNLGKITQEEVETLDISQVPVSYITRSAIRQEFFNIVSGIEGVIYRSSVEGKGEIFEIGSDVRNIIKIFNYFYGTNVTTIDQLGDKILGISTDNRGIVFTLENEDYAPNTINISVEDKEHSAYFNMVVNIREGHTFISVAERKKIDSRVVDCGVSAVVLDKMLQSFNEKKDDPESLRLASIFTMLASKFLLRDKKIAWDLSRLYLVYYTLALQTPEDKLEVVEDILERRPEYYESCKQMVHNLIETFPLNDGYLMARLSESIIKSKLGEIPFFQDILKQKILREPAFYDDHEKVGKILKFVLESGDKEIAEIIVNNPYFKACWGEMGNVAILALEKGYQEIALKIIENPIFDSWSSICEVIEKGYKNIALKMAKNPKFGGWSWLFQLLKKKHLDIATVIVNHPNFDASSWEVGLALISALEQGRKDIALKIANNSKLKKFEPIFRLFPKKGSKDVALAVVNNPNFDAGHYQVWPFLSLLLSDQKYKEVLLEVIKHPSFDRFVSILRKALEKENQEIALAIVDHPRFSAHSEYFIPDVLLLALQKREYKILLKIIEHSTFDISKMWVKAFLNNIQELLQKRAKESKQVQEIVDAIEHKRSEKNDNN